MSRLLDAWRAWSAAWKNIRLRRCIRAEARYLARVGAMDVRVLEYIEDLERRMDAKDRELRRLRDAQTNARLAVLESTQDCREWSIKTGVDPKKAERLLMDLGLGKE